MCSLKWITWISHTLGAAVFLLDPWTKQSVKNQALLSKSFVKTSIKFLVPSINISIWFHSYLRTPSVYHRMDKSCFNSHCQKNFFSKSCSPVTNLPRNVFLFRSQHIGSCDPDENITNKILLRGLANVFACSRIEDCIAVFGKDYQFCDSIL